LGVVVLVAVDVVGGSRVASTGGHVNMEETALVCDEWVGSSDAVNRVGVDAVVDRAVTARLVVVADASDGVVGARGAVVDACVNSKTVGAGSNESSPTCIPVWMRPSSVALSAADC
jgi:hypothetical protein